jgi:hypothetical protein
MPKKAEVALTNIVIYGTKVIVPISASGFSGCKMLKSTLKLLKKLKEPLSNIIIPASARISNHPYSSTL